MASYHTDGAVREVGMVWVTPRHGERDDLALHLIADCLQRDGSFLRETLLGGPIGGLRFEAQQMNLSEGSLFFLHATFGRKADHSKVEKAMDTELDSLRMNAGSCSAHELRDRRIARLRRRDAFGQALDLALGEPTAEESISRYLEIEDADLAHAMPLLDRGRRLLLEIW